MHGYGLGMGYFPGMGIFFWIFLLIAVFMIVSLFKNKKEDRYEAHDKSLEILRNRYAKGEISKEEYLSMKDTLEA